MTETSEVMDQYLHALRDGSDFSRLFAPDVVWTTMETGERVEGRDAVRDHIAALHTQLFDAHPQLVRLLTGDGVAMLEAVFTGRQIAAWGDVPATGREVRMPYAMTYDVAGGLITALYAYFPVTALHAQLTRSELSGSAPH